MEFKDKVKTVGFVQPGRARTRVEKAGGGTVVHKDHWDGRKDAIVRPDVVRYGSRVHNTGRQRGKVAEVRELTPKERRARHGE